MVAAAADARLTPSVIVSLAPLRRFGVVHVTENEVCSVVLSTAYTYPPQP
jgi:hypothetical protein